MARLNAPRGRRGIALVEIAIVLPLLFALLCGLLEYGWLFFKQQQISGTARAACRFGITQPATYEQTMQKIQQLMAEDGFADGTYTAECTMPTQPGAPVSVLIKVPYANESLELIGFPLVPVPDVLNGKTTMAKEGPP